MVIPSVVPAGFEVDQDVGFVCIFDGYGLYLKRITG